jgi:hypothetical protein
MGIFVGRDHELRALDALLDAALAGEGNVALVPAGSEGGARCSWIFDGRARRARPVDRRVELTIVEGIEYPSAAVTGDNVELCVVDNGPTLCGDLAQ